MDNLFFIASKTVGMLARAESWLVILMALGLWGTWRRRRSGTVFTATALVLLLALTIFPLANPLMRGLERQYPEEPALGRVDGIIVLGGGEDLAAYARRGSYQFNDAGERLVAGVELARRFPQARLIYTGGTAGLLANPDPGLPSRMVREFWLRMGVPDAQIALEARSRNTAENAVFTRAMIQPVPGQTWVLVTSAWHMPRAMETFRRNGWQGLVAWPVDFRASGPWWRMEWRLDDHLVALDTALKEELGLLAYRLAGM
jgi:uncharacterized SAM-binding protein YcdF (DUF218 family)